MLNFSLKALGLMFLNGIRLHCLLYVHSSFSRKKRAGSLQKMGFI